MLILIRRGRIIDPHCEVLRYCLPARVGMVPSTEYIDRCTKPLITLYFVLAMMSALKQLLRPRSSQTIECYLPRAASVSK